MKLRCENDSCRFISRQYRQNEPRLCIKCGSPEIGSIDLEKVKIFQTKEVTFEDLNRLMSLLDQRNLYIKKFGKPNTDDLCQGMVTYCNAAIKEILNL